MIRQYSLKLDGDRQLSANFKVREFACKDGSDVILIDDDLIEILQRVRDKFQRGVYITSGYRTISYNARIGGAVRSRHLSGQAADIDVGAGPDQLDPLLVAMTAQVMEVQGIGCYQYADGQSWVHLDSRLIDSFWMQKAPGELKSVPTFLPTLRKETPMIINDQVRVLQQLLKALKLYSGDLDKKYGPMTLAAVKAFQKQEKLAIDGVCGPVTWKTILLKRGV